MTSEYIVLVILAGSSLVSFIYLLYAIIRRSLRLALNAMIMLLTPLVGPLFYLGGFLTEKVRRGSKKLQDEDINFSKEKHGRLVAPDYDSEIQTVPLEEVLIISQTSEKRQHLLRELKKDEVENYSMLVKALDNDDPETAHYAASAISSAKSDFENNVRKLDYEYLHEDGSKDIDFVRRYSDYLLKFMRSGILDSVEMRKYSYSFVNILSRVEEPEKFLDADDYINIVSELISLGEFTLAMEWAQRSFDNLTDSTPYLLLAKVYYYTGRPDSLNEIIRSLMQSDVPLSSEGLAFIRFFMRKPKAMPVAEAQGATEEPAAVVVEPVAEPAAVAVEPVAEPAAVAVEPVAEPAAVAVEPVAEPAAVAVESVEKPAAIIAEPEVVTAEKPAELITVAASSTVDKDAFVASAASEENVPESSENADRESSADQSLFASSIA